MSNFKKQDYQHEKECYYVHKHGLLFIVYKNYFQYACASFWDQEKDSEWLNEEQAHMHAELLNKIYEDE